MKPGTPRLRDGRVACAAPGPRRDALKGLAATGLSLLAAARPAAAERMEDWPSRPVRLIVPYAPGGTTDIVARRYAEFLRTRVGQPVVVESRGGAATNIGTEVAARSAPDGYTLLLGSTSLASNPT